VARLTREEVVTIQVLSEKSVPSREIARQLGVTEGTVRYHSRRRAEGRVDGRRLQAQKAADLSMAVDAWRAARGECGRPINVRELYEHLLVGYGYAGSYKSVLRYVRRRFGRPKIRTWRRVETLPGAQAQTDWGDFPSVWVGGEEQLLHSFVMTLSHSRMPAIVWSVRKDQVSWIACHNGAFKRLGGIPAVNRIDNEKTAISNGAGSWGTVHPVYAAYARTLRFHVDACQPREPQAKGKVEAKVKLTRRVAAPDRRHYDSLEELQEESDERSVVWAKRARCPATGKTVYESWELEREHLSALPAVLPEPFDVVVHRPVHPDCMVHFEGREYPVPFRYVGRRVEVRGCAGRVQIVCDDEIVREHPRHTDELVLVDPSCYEGEATERVLPPPRLGKMGRKLAELYALPVEQRPLDLYAALAEVGR
jgi:transposase